MNVTTYDLSDHSLQLLLDYLRTAGPEDGPAYRRSFSHLEVRFVRGDEEAGACVRLNVESTIEELQDALALDRVARRFF